MKGQGCEQGWGGCMEVRETVQKARLEKEKSKVGNAEGGMVGGRHGGRRGVETEVLQEENI